MRIRQDSLQLTFWDLVRLAIGKQIWIPHMWVYGPWHQEQKDERRIS